MLEGAFAPEVPAREVEALWGGVFTAADAPGFQPRDGEGEDGEVEGRDDRGDEEAEELRGRADADNSGTVSWEEFLPVG